VKPRAAWRSAPAVVVGAGAAALLLAPSLRIPGHRGAARIASGFVPGRWDARFAVARGPAALALPKEPLRATLRLSGPAALTVRTSEGERHVALTDQPAAIDVILPNGGRAELAADATVRLHEIVLTRLGPAPWPRAVLVMLAALAAAAVAVRLAGAWATPVSVALTAMVVALALHGRLAGLALAAGFDRLAPVLAILALGALFLLPRMLPRGHGAARAPDDRWAAAFGLLALVSCLAQVLLLPQPLLIGDPAAYHDIGRRFAAAIAEVRGLRDVGDAAQTLRPYGGLAATGLLYGALLLLRDDVSTLYVAHALAMAAAVAFLVRAAARIGGRRLATVTGVLALLYPTFPVLCGIVQPEPAILLLWTFALDRVLQAREEASLRRFAAAGLAFGLGLALHPQGLWFLLAALVLVAIPFTSSLLHPPVRAWTAAFALGLLPVAAATAVGEMWSRPAAHVLDERHGFWAYTARVPLGFWLFIDAAGWQGPLRIDDTRYARGLRAAEEQGAVHGAVGRVAYTAFFVSRDPALAARTVLRNLHRLFHVPDNPFRRDWILPYALQVAWHRALVVLFLLAVPLILARRAAALLVPVTILAATYPLYHVFNKYAVPATPFILLGAALALERLLVFEARLGSFVMVLGVAALGAALAPGDLVLRGVPTGVAQALPPLLQWGGLAGAFLLAARRWAEGRTARAATALFAALFFAAFLAASWGDPSSRALEVTLSRPVRHEIAPGPDGLVRLAAARAAWVLLDLRLPDGQGATLRLAFDGGTVMTGRDLQPTMPTFGLATIRGARDPRTFRQWWAVRFDNRMVMDDRVALTIEDPSGAACLYGDLGAPQGAGVDPGLSLGQWPYLSVYRLMHDGEYRLATRQLLSGSRASGIDGRALPGALGIRLVIVDEAGGPPPWEAGPTARPWRPLAVY
jgi:dolichyl-phosphate-mannose-protein mannosyltransferase